MLARLQQFITLMLLAVALAWLLVFWDRSALLALVGFAAVLFGYSAVLALEFLALRWVNRQDPTPQPS